MAIALLNSTSFALVEPISSDSIAPVGDFDHEISIQSTNHNTRFIANFNPPAGKVAHSMSEVRDHPQAEARG